MEKKIYVCDFKHEVELLADERRKFAIDGQWFEIDLCTDDNDSFQQLMDQYLAAGRRIGRYTSAPTRKSHSSVDVAAVRAWALENGYEVSDRGRIAADVLAAYNSSTQ